MQRRARERGSLPARLVFVLGISVSLALLIAACGGSKPGTTAQPTTVAPAAAATTAVLPASPTDTPLPSAPPVVEDEQFIEPEMVLIPDGEFTMGSDPGLDPEAMDDEGPPHTLHLPDYYLARTPVTNAQYAAFVQATDHRQPYHWKGKKAPRGTELHPVVNVSWFDALAYSDWLAEVTGRPYRLPSEAEWEKGARGDDGRIYPWGSEWNPERCNSREGGQGDTTPVDAYPEGASPYGSLDMAGNVWEWTSTAYKAYPYDPEDGREELQVGDDVRRVLRGGAFVNLGWRLRSAFRGRDLPDFSFYDRGFRVAMDAEQ